MPQLRSVFEAFLRAHFVEVSIILQRPVFGSVLLPAAAETAAPFCFRRRGADHFEASNFLAHPQYIFAFACEEPASFISCSVYIEIGQLGMLTSAESASLLERAQASGAAERARADAAATENAYLRAEVAALRGQVVTISADLATSRGELAMSHGEAKGLLVANMMAEQACIALRSELSRARDAEVAAQHELGRMRQLEEATQQAFLSIQAEAEKENNWTRKMEDDLANVLASHSWKVTAPLRSISRILYRRP